MKKKYVIKSIVRGNWVYFKQGTNTILTNIKNEAHIFFSKKQASKKLTELKKTPHYFEIEEL